MFSGREDGLLSPKSFKAGRARPGTSGSVKERGLGTRLILQPMPLCRSCLLTQEVTVIEPSLSRPSITVIRAPV